MNDDTICAIAGFVAGSAITGLIVLALTMNYYQQEAIKRDFAQYNQKSGQWEWKVEPLQNKE